MAAPDPMAAGTIPRRLFAYSAGFFTQTRLRRILTLAGHEVRLGLPGPEDGVVVWGRSPYAWRGERVAARAQVPLIRIEDAFMRSVRPGRMGDAAMGLLIDAQGVHFDSATPSRLETLLATQPFDDAVLLSRARDAMARLQALDLSKYNLHDLALPPPDPGYVLVIDQTRGDASISHSGATPARFAEMLALACEEHPTARIVIKTHPETQAGLRPGHFGPQDAQGRVSLCTRPLSPWGLLEGAVAVYTVASQLGFEAILAGHRPVVMGQPFYAGWGLSDDRFPVDRRRRKLTRTQLFAGAMLLAPTWYDPCRDRLCPLEAAIDQIEAEVRAFRQDRFGHVASGMRLWKRGRLQAFFGRETALKFADPPEKAAELAQGRGLLVWAGKAPAALTCLRVEDGFLRSRGLGAELVPPLSLVTDDLGIYYDPMRESRLERLIRAPLPPGGAARAEALRHSLITQRISKYNLTRALPELPPGLRLLVPGQVEDDASIRLGAGAVRSNLALLQKVRVENPSAVIIYKPHPDVEAGLRPGAITPAALTGLADVVAHASDPIALIEACDAVWTMTSLLGFEALLRGKPVICLGAPFYAGWGLTRDLGPVPARRMRAPDGHPLPLISLDALTHAALIAYPRYYDPVSRLPCPPETAVERLASGPFPHPGTLLRMVSKLQGALAGQAHLWR
jgi:capsular polysaccharide export protein